MLIEARLTWEAEVLAVAHVQARGVVRVADLGLAGFADDFTIAFEHGRLTCDAIQNGASILWLSYTEGERLPAGELGEFRTTKGVALAAVLHAMLLVMAFIGRGEPTEGERLGVMRGYLASSDARQLGDSAPPPVPPQGEGGPLAKPGEKGMAGSPMQARTSGIHARSKTAPPPEVQRRQELDEAREFGMIGLLIPRASGREESRDPFATFEGPSAVGSIFGTTIDDAFGFGGAGLSGVGLGGGGQGHGVGLELGGGGTCGAGPCAWSGGSAFGMGKGSGRLMGGHRTAAVSCRCGETQVNGRLPPETIQRIVRQNFGRMRMCYEAGLVRNPSLEGRVEVKFVIDRSGGVSMADAGAGSLADSDVMSCIGRAFRSMSFPEPQGGIVTVVYPLVLGT